MLQRKLVPKKNNNCQPMLTVISNPERIRTFIVRTGILYSIH